MTKPNGTGLPAFFAEDITINGASTNCENATCSEKACEFTETRISCVDKNLGSSTAGLLETLQAMNATELGQFEWLIINQNEGLDADQLVDIMALLINLERLSLNSDSLW